MNRKAALGGKLILLLSVSVIVTCAQTQSSQDTSQKGPGGGIFRVGAGVTPPRALLSPDPEYSERARRVGYTGTCVLWLIIDTKGVPRDIRVAHAIGMGLDEKAIEAVHSWRFSPAMKDGEPVAVQINVEVSFRLWNGATEFEKLSHRADSGNADAQYQLSQLFLSSHDSADESQGLPYLQKAAKQGLPKAQFAMGEFLSSRRNDLVAAYVWYSLAQKNHYKHSENRLSELTNKMTPEQLVEARRRVDGGAPN